MRVMFDTNIFNSIVKNEIDISTLKGKIKVYATHVQYDELKATNDKVLRQKFLELFEHLTNEVPTESAIWDVSNWDQAKWGGEVVNTESAIFEVSRYGKAKFGGSNLCKDIWQKLDEKNGNKKNNSKDALIAETAILNNLTLITHDADLFFIITHDFKSPVSNLYALISQYINHEPNVNA